MANNLRCDDGVGYGLFDSEEDEAKYEIWYESISDYRKKLERADKNSLIFIHLLVLWEHEKLGASWRELFDSIGELGAVIENDPNLKAKYWRTVELFKSEAYAEVRENLSIGGPLGVKARQEKAKKQQAALDDAIKGLFDKPEKPGWGWTNPEIVTFLKKGNYGYADGTLMVKVKREAAKYRKARKTEQAGKLSITVNNQ